MYNEFEALFTSLFFNPQNHISFVRALATKCKGLTRVELLFFTKIENGGSVTKTLQELIAAGFITLIFPFGKSKKDSLYRLTDAYCLFCLQFIEKHKKATNTVLQHLQITIAWKIWCGYAFENVCIAHINKIKQKLGISAIYTEISSFAIKTANQKQGFQIDLLIDRAENIINICEMKYYDAAFTLTKDYAAKLRQRVSNFREASGTQKTIILLL